ncbi:MAG TPA: hydroxymethylglutaryl-CoA lyase [Acidimicrobiales bacterium]|nr:hydroxymethylglutaryl-CoA lyase [Acidimicrobiales bacterium]
MSGRKMRVGIVEVSPRDGLQDEPTVLPTATKVDLVDRALAAGITRVEVASFVRADRVPTMADGEQVVAGVTRRPGVALSGLVLNKRGMDRAVAAGVDEVNFVVLATETFSQRNNGMSVDDALATWAEVAAVAVAAGIRPTVTLGASFGCPYEGRVDPTIVRRLAAVAVESGPAEIALADTIGCAVPPEVTALVRDVAADTGLPVRVHLHNSRNTGFANALAAVEAGAYTLDASIGGIGGCPFAPGATGNVATEDLVHLLDRMGIDTGVDLGGVIEAARWLEGELGHAVPGQVLRAGPFPPVDRPDDGVDQRVSLN